MPALTRMRVMAAVLPMTIVGAAAALVLAHGCGSPEATVAGADAGSDAADADADGPKLDAGADVDSSPSESGPEACAPRPFPPDVPAGWLEYTDWACDCPFYIPGDPSTLPAPIEWEPCPSTAPLGMACRHMRPFWSSSGFWYTDARSCRFSIDETRGTPMLAFTRSRFAEEHSSHGDYSVIVADVDGPVHVAIYQRHSVNEGCYLSLESLNGRHYSMSALGGHQDVPHDYTLQGTMGGEIDELRPGVLIRHENVPNGRAYSGFVSRDHIVEWSGGLLTLIGWDGTSSEQIYPTEAIPEYLPAMKIFHLGTDLIFGVNEGGQTGIMSWDKDHGTQPLRRWYNDPTRGAGNLGTDGKTMVWLEGNGRSDASPGSYLFDSADVMTAPYTTDPDQLEANTKRLRSSPRPVVGSSGEEFAIGCGYSARNVDGACQLEVIRLADGYAWSLPCAKEGTTWRWSWTRALGVTCDEVFASAYFDDGTRKSGTIARIRLDSLGEPSPPD